MALYRIASDYWTSDEEISLSTVIYPSLDDASSACEWYAEKHPNAYWDVQVFDPNDWSSTPERRAAHKAISTSYNRYPRDYLDGGPRQRTEAIKEAIMHKVQKTYERGGDVEGLHHEAEPFYTKRMRQCYNEYDATILGLMEYYHELTRVDGSYSEAGEYEIELLLDWKSANSHL